MGSRADEEGERYIEVMRSAANVISELTGWAWYEDIARPGDAEVVTHFADDSVVRGPHGNYYEISFTPKGVEWFSGLGWSDVDKQRHKDWREIFMGTAILFKVPEDEHQEFYDKIEVKIKEGQRIARKWAKRASTKFGARIGVVIGDWGEPFFDYPFEPEDFDPETIKSAFRALKYAFEGSRRELKEKKIEISAS